MKSSFILAILFALARKAVAANGFNIWSVTANLGGGCNPAGGCENDRATGIIVSERDIPHDEAVCSQLFPHLNLQDGPYCNMPMYFHNGCAILRNCYQSDPDGMTEGHTFADVEDCDGGYRGFCWVWYEGQSGQACGRELGRMSKSMLACETADFDGKDFKGWS